LEPLWRQVVELWQGWDQVLRGLELLLELLLVEQEVSWVRLHQQVERHWGLTVTTDKVK
jgi:hypothetical protein